MEKSLLEIFDTYKNIDTINYKLEQSTGNRKTWARIPAQSKVSFSTERFSNSLNINYIY